MAACENGARRCDSVCQAVRFSCKVVEIRTFKYITTENISAADDTFRSIENHSMYRIHVGNNVSDKQTEKNKDFLQVNTHPS